MIFQSPKILLCTCFQVQEHRINYTSEQNRMYEFKKFELRNFYLMSWINTSTPTSKASDKHLMTFLPTKSIMSASISNRFFSWKYFLLHLDNHKWAGNGGGKGKRIQPCNWVKRYKRHGAAKKQFHYLQSQHQFLKKTNLAVARRTVKVLSPIFKPLRAAHAMSVTDGSWSVCTLVGQ